MKYRIIDMMLGVATLCLTCCFFIPLSIFLLNQNEFYGAKEEMARLLFSVSLGSFIILSLLVIALGPKSRLYTLPVLAFLTMGIWIQGYIFNWDYGIFDGSSLDFKIIDWRAADSLLWLVLAIAIIIGIIKKVSFRSIFLGLLFIQAGNLIFSLKEPPPLKTESERQNWTAAAGKVNQFTFSEQKNIIVLILDAFQTDFFNEYLEENPGFSAKLPGFTYYPDALATDYYTHRSLPVILTGRIHDHAVPLTEYLSKDSMPAHLKKAGYYVGIHNFFKFAQSAYQPSLFKGIADNYSGSPENFEPYYGLEIRQLLATALFRTVPHAAKNLVYTRYFLDTALEQDRDIFVHDIRQYGRVSGNQPRFSFYHLQGFHGPHVIDGVLLDHTKREELKRIISLLAGVIDKFIITLQNLGLYNDAAIFIVGDHGHQWSGSDIRFGKYDTSAIHGEPPLDPFAKKPRALPLVLFKPPNAGGNLAISDKAVSLLDITPTVLDVAGIEPASNYEGISLLRLDDKPRFRRFFSSEYKTRSKTPSYEYVVSGFSWYDRSWTFTGNAYDRKGIKKVIFDTYQPGTVISFGQAGNGAQYLDANWKAEEKKHVTHGPDAIINLPVEDVNASFKLCVEMSPEPQTDQSIPQTVSVYINKAKADDFTLNGTGKIVVNIPAATRNSKAAQQVKKKTVKRTEQAPVPKPCENMLEIRFEMHDNVSSRPSGADKSEPGPAMAIHSLVLQKQPS